MSPNAGSLGPPHDACFASLEHLQGCWITPHATDSRDDVCSLRSLDLLRLQLGLYVGVTR